MPEPISIERLWESARRYLQHAIKPNSPLASAVRLRLHGDIKLGRWLPFTAEQVIGQRDAMLWNATVRIGGIPVFRGFDRLLNGAGEMRWKILGIVPFIHAHGDDITRSAAGRVAAELVWLPSMLCADDVSWKAPQDFQPEATVTVNGERPTLRLAVDAYGRLKNLTMRRWGNPGGKEFRYEDFGGVAEEEKDVWRVHNSESAAHWMVFREPAVRE